MIRKVGLVLNSLNGAGAQKTLLTLASQLVSFDVRVDCFVVNRNSNDYNVRGGVGLVYLEGDTEQDKKNYLLNHSKSSSYDLFITSQPDFYDYFEAKKKYCSVHHTPTSWNDRKTWRFWQKYHWKKRDEKYYRSKNLIALSEGIKNDLVCNLGCDADRVKVINNPFDIDGIRNKSLSKENVPEYSYMVYVASLSERKRHADLFYAFSRIKDKSIKLVLVGKGSNERRLKNLAEKLKITDRVVFWGWDANPYRLVRRAKLAVLASRAEGLPRVVVESLAIGTPVVSTDCRSGPKEVLTGEFSNFLVPVGGVKEMIVAIDLALVSYPAIPSSFVDHFDSKYIAQQYLSLMESD